MTCLILVIPPIYPDDATNWMAAVESRKGMQKTADGRSTSETKDEQQKADQTIWDRRSCERGSGRHVLRQREVGSSCGRKIDFCGSGIGRARLRGSGRHNRRSNDYRKLRTSSRRQTRRSGIGGPGNVAPGDTAFGSSRVIGDASAEAQRGRVFAHVVSTLQVNPTVGHPRIESFGGGGVCCVPLPVTSSRRARCRRHSVPRTQRLLRLTIVSRDGALAPRLGPAECGGGFGERKIRRCFLEGWVHPERLSIELRGSRVPGGRFTPLIPPSDCGPPLPFVKWTDGPR
ncbi:hypothetical protein HPB51_016832 [Rhipicephalus microplus]|uniref:Uncharacterized protein n=1 Tax=Rhipicephalus microplus TaxID=6941 RepID=A0A9J6EHC4_RHIMP|nr:hypothetical protein HPB51_016832 [Rhipicephalus microplus]